MPNNLLQLEPYGFTVIPRIRTATSNGFFIPRAAVESVEVLGVWGGPLRKREGQNRSQGADRVVRRVATGRPARFSCGPRRFGGAPQICGRKTALAVSRTAVKRDTVY